MFNYWQILLRLTYFAQPIRQKVFSVLLLLFFPKSENLIQFEWNFYGDFPMIAALTVPSRIVAKWLERMERVYINLGSNVLKKILILTLVTKCLKQIFAIISLCFLPHFQGQFFVFNDVFKILYLGMVNIQFQEWWILMVS